MVVQGAAKTVYIGGQDAVDGSGEIVGKGDIAAQSAQVFKNLETVLKAAGGSLHHIIKWNIYVVQGQPMEPAFRVYQQAWGNHPNPPAITVAYVVGLANPDFLVEMDAIAVIPE